MPRFPIAFVLLAIALSGCAATVGSPTPTPTVALLNELRPDEEVPCTPKSEVVDDSVEVAATEANALPEDEFWSYIDRLDGTVTEEGLAELTDELADAGIETALAFDVRLALALYELDSACRAEWYRVNEPDQLGFVSDDVFLYARADTVSAGRAVWEEAVADETLPWGEADPSSGMGEMLLYAGISAGEQLGVSMDEYFDRLFALQLISYETASNPNGWPQQ